MDAPPALWTAVLEQIGESVEITDPEGRILYVNRAFEENTGYTRDEACGKTPKELLRSDEHDAGFFDDMWETISSGREWRGKMISRAKDGRYLHQESTIRPVLDDQGRIAHFVAVRRDITERVQMEEQLRRAERMSAMGRVAAGVAHEINNPLQYVVGNISWLADHEALPDHPELRKAIADAMEGAERVQEIVRDLKTFSRVDAAIGTVDLQRALMLSTGMARSVMFQRANLSTDWKSAPSVRGNAAKLGQIFLNLLINAVEALPEEQADRNEVRVSAKAIGERVAVEISDNGPGINPRIMGQIFEPFFTTKPVGAGTGLGLSVVRALLDEMGGDIEVDSELGEGTTFRVWLPKAADDASPAAEPIKTRAAPPARSGHILVIDDEPRIARWLVRVLPEHDVIAASSGLEALAHLDRNPFDIVFCDLIMPGQNGMDVFESVQSRAPAMAERFVVMTGAAYTDRAKEFVGAIANRCLEKPLEREQIRELVGQLLSKWQPARV